MTSIPPAPAPTGRRGRKPAHRRNRSWETNHPPVTFVGVPSEIREDIRNLADSFRREYGTVGGVDAVARELLGYALRAYDEGNLKMFSLPPKGKTLLQSSEGWGTTRRDIPARPPKTSKPPAASMSYRLPPEQVEAIRNIIPQEEQKAAPQVVHLTLGQVVTRLFLYALEAYRNQVLELYPVSVMTVQGLASEAK